MKIQQTAAVDPIAKATELEDQARNRLNKLIAEEAQLGRDLDAMRSTLPASAENADEFSASVLAISTADQRRQAYLEVLIPAAEKALDEAERATGAAQAEVAKNAAEAALERMAEVDAAFAAAGEALNAALTNCYAIREEIRQVVLNPLSGFAFADVDIFALSLPADITRFLKKSSDRKKPLYASDPVVF